MGGSARSSKDCSDVAVGRAAPVLEVIQKAAAACGDTEVEPGVSMHDALSNPRLRAAAAKWRSGSESRRVTALFARMMNGLHSIKPAWLEGVSAAVEPTPVDPLPLHHNFIGPAAPPTRLAMIFTWLWNCCRIRTLCLAVMILCFPKIFALFLTAIMRLLVRAVLALLGRLLTEVGRELRDMIFQVTLATTSTEEALLHYLENFFTLVPSPPSLLEPSPPNPHSIPAADLPMSPHTAPCPQHPNPPWSFVSCMLLVADLILRLRPMGGAG